MTEFWSSDPSVVDGTHDWISDQGIATYNPVRYDIQRIYTTAASSNTPLTSNEKFVLQLDTRNRVGGKFFQTPTNLLNSQSTAADVKNAIEMYFNPMHMSNVS